MLACAHVFLLTCLVSGEVAEVGPKKKPAARNTLLSAPAARLQIEVIEAQISESSAEGLDADALAAPDYSAVKLLAALRKLGEAKLVIRDSRPVVLGKDHIELRHGKKTPFVANRNRLANGRTQSVVQYEDVGVSARLRLVEVGRDDSGKLACVLNADVEYSNLVESDVEMDTGVRAPVFHKMSAEQMLKVESGKPSLMSTVQRMTDRKDDPGEFAVLIVRIEVRPD
jgi:hypothetical protein